MSTIAPNSNDKKHIDMYPTRHREKSITTPRVDPVVYSEDLSSSPINPEFIEQYERDGFLILEDIFSPEEVTLFQDESAKLRNDESYRGSGETIIEPESAEVRSVFRIHQISEVYKKLAADTRLAGLARYLLNDEVYIHQSRINFKPGFSGKEFYWHSDFETWHSEDGLPRLRTLSISLTLTQNYEYNGPLMLIPGSQNTFLGCKGETPENNHNSSLKKQDIGVPSHAQLEKLVSDSEIITATGKPGTIVIFDANTMHGSAGNLSPFPRSNAFFVYNAISNTPVDPFCGQSPRPEYIAHRKDIQALKIGDMEFNNA